MWTLVIYIYAGMMADGDSVALTHVDGLRSQQECKAAGEAGKSLVSGSKKEYRYLCVQTFQR